MADVTPRTFFSGASLVWGRQRILWLIYVVNFVLVYFATRGTNERIGAILDHSLASGQLLHGFNLGSSPSLARIPTRRSADLHFGYLPLGRNPLHGLHDLCHRRNPCDLLFRPAASCRRILRSLRPPFLAVRPIDDLSSACDHSCRSSRRNRATEFVRSHQQAIDLANACGSFL